MSINFRRAFAPYPSGDRYYTYVPASEYYSQFITQEFRYYTIGTLNAPTAFPTDAAAKEYFDSVIPASMVSAYNLATGASETVGIIAEFNPDTVRADIKSVQDDVDALGLQWSATHTLAEGAVAQAADALAAVADAVSDIGELQDELDGIASDLASAATLSDFQTGVTLDGLSNSSFGTALPTTLPLLTILGDLVANVNTTNDRVNAVAVRVVLAEAKINALIAALESKTILTP